MNFICKYNTNFLNLFLCMCYAWLSVCAPCACKCPWNPTYRQLCTTMWVLGTESGYAEPNSFPGLQCNWNSNNAFLFVDINKESYSLYGNNVYQKVYFLCFIEQDLSTQSWLLWNLLDQAELKFIEIHLLLPPNAGNRGLPSMSSIAPALT